MKNHKLLIIEGREFSQKALFLLNKVFDIKIVTSIEMISDNDFSQTDFLWIRLHNYIGNDFIKKMTKLKAIVTATTGLDCIDLDACRISKIDILSLADEFKFLKQIKATAELTILLMFLLLRNIIPACTDVMKNNRFERDLFKGNEIYQKKIGLVGYGRLGKLVADYLKVFGVKVYVYDPYVKSKIKGIKNKTLKEIFSTSDIVSIHAKHTPETHKMINEEILSYIRKPIYLINTARGEILDEDAILKFLRNGKIAKAALDVIADETRQNIGTNKLIQYAKNHQNLIITPHLGGCCFESFEKTEIFIAKKLLKYYKKLEK